MMRRSPGWRAARICGAVAGPLFVGTFLVEGASRGGGYSAIRHPVSSLQLGPYGWVQVANFLVAGGLLLVFAVGGRGGPPRPDPYARWGARVLAAAAIGLLGSGVFITDPVNGYPADAPALSAYTWHGALHDLFAVPTFLGWPVAMALFAAAFARRGERGPAVTSGVAAALFGAGFVLTNLGFAQVGGLEQVAGLLQRLTVVVGWTWVTVLAVARATGDVTP